MCLLFFFFSSRRRHTRFDCDWSSDVCSSDLFTNFMGAVIDRNAFRTITGYIDFARRSPDAEVLAGGGADDSKGYFVEPTVVLAKRPDLTLMREEIFGPVLTVYVFEDSELDEALALCDPGSPYALTGAIFARDRSAR